MGRTRGPYLEEYPIGTFVRVADRDALERFRREWQLHHPLEPSQLEFSGVASRVLSVGFYHGGDELYELEGIPGIWHEACLARCDALPDSVSIGEA